MATSEQLEREAEEVRANISGCLDELRARMTPGQVLDQVLDYGADSSAGMFMHNFRQQVVANPLPLTLVGAGLAWIAMASRKSNGISPQGNISRQVRGASGSVRDTAKDFGKSTSRAAGEWSEGASETAGEWAQRAKDKMGGWAGRARGTVEEMSDRTAAISSEVRDATRRGTDTLSDAASDTYEEVASRTRDAASGIKDSARSAVDSVSEAASAASGYASDAKRTLGQFFNDQPLVLAGLGVALGAIIGAALPATEAENELMGKNSDELKDHVGETAQEQVDKGKSMVKEAAHAVEDEVDKQFGVSGNPEQQSQTRPSTEPSLVPTE